jgi:prepilin-type N-terminal cleavage/methylation domain-containing protein
MTIELRRVVTSNPARATRTRDDARGFSLLELLMVTALIATVAGIAIPVSTGLIGRMRADSAATVATTTVQAARNRAVAERRNVQLNFVGTHRITLERHEVPGPATTIVDDVELTEGLEFTLFGELPDTPDLFGNAEAIQFSGTAPFMFTSDGSLIDSNGDVVNGTIFMGRPTDVGSARAITIFGVTGFIQSWKWTGAEWVQ